jgi:hypothetical protein
MTDLYLRLEWEDKLFALEPGYPVGVLPLSLYP